MNRHLRAYGLLGALLVFAFGFTAGPEDEEANYSVYLRLLSSADATVAEVVDRLANTYEAAGWTVVASVPVEAVPDQCTASGTTLVLYDPTYADQLLEQGPFAAFALPIRLSVFQDEMGVHASVMDPRNLNRTMVAEEGMSEAWEGLAARLVSVAETAFPGEVSPLGYGQWRDEGRIGRTFGIMAGGPFPDKVEEVLTVEDETRSPAELGQLLMDNMNLPGQWEWGLRGVYVLEVNEDLTLVGVTGTEMEARAFRIVGNGNQDEREELACAGIDHAPAFPLALAIQRWGSITTVSMVDEMYRMKMYFEDAGKMAFARNMSMPGSIENEIRDKVEMVLLNF